MNTATISPGQIRRGPKPPDGEGSVQVSMETGAKIGNEQRFSMHANSAGRSKVG